MSRDTFYRVKEAKDSGGMEALLHKDRRRANLKNRVDEQVEQAILAFALENPAAGQVRVSNELRKRNIHVSPTGVRSVWLRHGLQTFRLRLAGGRPRRLASSASKLGVIRWWFLHCLGSQLRL